MVLLDQHRLLGQQYPVCLSDPLVQCYPLGQEQQNRGLLVRLDQKVLCFPSVLSDLLVPLDQYFLSDP